MRSQAGSPPGGDSSLQLPAPPKKRSKKEGGPSKPKGKGKARDVDADEAGQQSRRQSQALQGGSHAEGSLSRSQGAGAAAQGGNADERPAKSQRVEKRGQQKMSRKNLFAKECKYFTRHTPTVVAVLSGCCIDSALLDVRFR